MPELFMKDVNLEYVNFFFYKKVSPNWFTFAIPVSFLHHICASEVRAMVDSMQFGGHMAGGGSWCVILKACNHERKWRNV